MLPFRDTTLWLKKLSVCMAVTSVVGLSSGKSALGVTVHLENYSYSDTNSSANGEFVNNWAVQKSGGDGGAAIVNNQLVLTNDATDNTNDKGRVWAYYDTNNFAVPYNSVLGLNVGEITWTFNMQQSRLDPSGFNFNIFNYGVAFILAASSTDFTSANGYAVGLGENEGINQLRLIRFTNGLQATNNELIANTITSGGNFGNQHLSIKVSYLPSTNTWKLFVRNDGNSFADPSTTSSQVGIDTVNSTYTNISLPYIGAFWHYSSGENQNKEVAKFDNIAVTVEEPVAVPYDFSPTNGVLIVAGVGILKKFKGKRKRIKIIQ